MANNGDDNKKLNGFARDEGGIELLVEKSIKISNIRLPESERNEFSYYAHVAGEVISLYNKNQIDCARDKLSRLSEDVKRSETLSFYTIVEALEKLLG